MEPIPSQPPRVQLVRMPLVLPAGAMIAGVVLGRYLPLGMGLWLAVGGLALAVAAVTCWRAHLHLAATAAVLAATLAFSAAYLRWVYYTVPDDHVVTHVGNTAMPATLEGRIVTSPMVERDDSPMAKLIDREYSTRFVLEATALQTTAGPQPVQGLVRVTVNEPAGHLRAGQRVRLVCKLGRFREPSNPGQRNQAQLARQKHVLVWATLPVADGVQVAAGDEQLPLHRRAYWHVRALFRQHLQTSGASESSDLVGALIIGERASSLQSLNESMVKAGTAHYLSISGSHLAIFLGFVYLLCRLAMLSPRWSAAGVLTVLTLYVLLAEPSPPLLRSALMATAVCAGVLVRRRNSMLNALAGSCIVLLLVDPLELFSAGFQLSFGIVLGIAVLTEPIRQRLFGRWLQRRGLRVFRHENRLQRFVYHRIADWSMLAIAGSAAAYLVSAPLVAYHFGLFSPYAGVLSLLLAPFVTLVLVPGYICLGLLWPAPNLSAQFGRLSTSMADLLAWMVGWMQDLPGVCLELRPIGPWLVVAFYAMVAIVLARRMIPLGTWVSLAGWLTLAGFVVHSQLAAPAPSMAQLHVLAVGSGQCTVLRCPSGKTYILDAGTRSSLDAHKQVLAPFLRQAKMPAVSGIVVSHGHGDHCNAVGPLLAAGRVESFWTNEYFAATRRIDAPVPELVAQLHEAGVPIARLAAGSRLQLDDRTSVEVLWPPPRSRRELGDKDLNETSLVLRITCDGKSVLLPGDVQSLGQSGLLEGGTLKSCDVLLLPHHGSYTRQLDAFVTRVAPRHVVISGGSAPVAGDPAKAAFYRRLGELDCRRTWQHGYTCVTFGAAGVSVSSMR